MSDQIDQAFEKIEELCKEGDLKNAYQLCLQIIEVDPENGKAIRLLDKLKGKIQEANIDELKKNIKALEPLWKEGRYQELVEKYHQLYELAPNYEPLIELIAKAEEKLKVQLTEGKKKFVENFEAELEKMFQEGKYEDLILKTSQTEAAYPSNIQLKEAGRKMRSKIVKAELEKNQPLLDSSKYTEIIKFLEKLKIIEPTNEKLDKLIAKYKRKGLTNLSDSQQEFVYKGLTHTETLLQLKKYEKAAETASEVLEVDPSNKKAKEFFKKAEKKAKKQIQKEVIARMRENFDELKKQYQENSTNFIKI